MNAPISVAFALRTAANPIQLPRGARWRRAMTAAAAGRSTTSGNPERCPPICVTPRALGWRADQGLCGTAYATSCGAPAACKTRDRHYWHQRPSRHLTCTKRITQSRPVRRSAREPARPNAVPSAEPRSGNRLQSEKGRWPLTQQTVSPPSRIPPSWGARGGRLKRAWAGPPRCSAENGTPIGDPAASTEQRRRPLAQQTASPPSDPLS